MKNIFFILLTMLGLGSCANAQSNGGYANMDVADFAKFIANDSVQLLDVRTPQEYEQGHIKGAVNIDIYDANFLSDANKELDKTQPVAVYCRSGKRSADAANRLAADGYNVTNLSGGILAWEKDQQIVR